MGLIDGEERQIKGASKKLLRERLLAEFVGTFFLVLAVGVAVAGGGANAPVAIGLLLSIQIFCFGSVSGGMFNPAVTLAVFLSRRGKIKAMDALAYAGVQILGGFFGALIAFACTEQTFCFHYQHNRGTGETFPDNWASCLFLEIFFTMALCQTVLHTGTSYDAPNHYFGFAIGGTVTASAFACGGFDQGSFNPAVTFGINIVNYMSNDKVTIGSAISDVNVKVPDAASWIIYLFAPLVGSCLAAAVFRGTRGEEYEAPSVTTTPVTNMRDVAKDNLVGHE
eukprot:TRINITY_DN82596_c0_g1_i1.p1 TRINITY_DN82596_c0_g1~~TRINITY_DN82596_c0_g1_i1.p1  ORF type:complete len:301 (-),score=33.25 TRINITY_DN82596_c0_g1_i1:36-878(-)